MASGTYSQSPPPPMREEAEQTPLHHGASESERYVVEQLNRTGRYLKLVDFFGGLLVWAVAVLGFLLVVAVVDAWVAELGFWARLGALTILAGGSLAYFLAFILPLAWRRINPAYSARTIEQSEATLKNSLINFLSFRAHREGVHHKVYDALQQRAAADLAHTPVESAIDYTRLLRFGYVLAGLLLLCGLYTVVSPKKPFATLSRILAPLSEVARPSVVQIERVEPGATEAFHGDQVTVAAWIRGLASDQPAVLWYSTADGQTVDAQLPMTADEHGDRYSVELPPGDEGVRQDLRYHLTAGDARSPEYTIRMIPAPRISVKQLRYDYPAYTGLPTQTVEDEADVKAVEGTRITVFARANQPIKGAYIELRPESGDDARPVSVSMTHDGQEAVGSFVLTLQPDRRTPRFVSYQVRFRTMANHLSRRPTMHRIEVTPDLKPEIEILTPKANRVPVPVNGSQMIEVRALDPDYGLSQIVLTADVAGTRLLEEKLLEDSVGRTGQQITRFEFVPSKLGLAPGNEVVYWAEARDNRTGPDGSPDPNQARTENFFFEIVEATTEGDTPPKPKEEVKPEDEKDERSDTPAEKPSKPETGDAGSRDAGSRDAGSRDAGSGDAGSGDAGSGDAGSAESGSESSDSGAEGGSGGQNDSGENAGGESSAGESGGDNRGGGASNQNDAGKGSQTGSSGGSKSDSPSQVDGQGESQGDAADSQSGGGSSSSNSSQKSNQRNPGGASSKSQDGAASDDAGGSGSAGEGAPRSEPLHDGEVIERTLEHLKERAAKGGGSRQGSPDHAEQSTGEDGDSDRSGEQPANRPGEQAGSEQAGSEGNKAGDNKSGGDSRNPEKSGNPGESASGGEGSKENQGSGDKPGSNAQPTQGEKSSAAREGGQPQDGGEASGGNKSLDPSQSQSGDSPRKSGGEPSGDASNPAGAGAKEEPSDPSGGQSGQPMGGGEKPESSGGGANEQKSPGGSQSGDESNKPQQPSGGGSESPSGGSQQKDEQKQGDNQSGGGTTQAQGENRQRQNGGGSSGGSQPKDGAQSPSNSQNQSSGDGDKSGDQGGDKSGGGSKGGGQDSNQPGEGSAGGSTPSDSGSGAADEPGDGETSNKPGGSKPGAAGSGNQNGEGSGTGGKSGSNTQQGAGGEQSAKQDGAQQQQPDDRQGERPGDAGREAKSDEAEAEKRSSGGKSASDTRSSKSGSNAGSEASGGGASPSGGGDGSSAPEAEAPPPDKANLEYARKATDLALEHLRDQKDKPDRELLDKLGMTEEELKAFVDRWEAMKRRAREAGPTDDSYTDSLRSLGLRPRADKQRAVGAANDELRGEDATPRSEPPPSFLEQFRAFKSGAARAENERNSGK